MPTEETSKDLVRDISYNASNFLAYTKIIDSHCDFFEKSRIPHVKLRSRVEVENGALGVLKKLESGDTYIVKGGDLDFFIEEEGKWGQIGGNNVLSIYRKALQKGVSIKVVGNFDPVRKHLTKAKEICEVLVQLGLKPKLANHLLKTVFTRKVDGNISGLVWYNFSSHGDYFESDDPSISTYEGYFISSEKKECLPFLVSLEKALIEIEAGATDYKIFLEKTENLFRNRRHI